MNENQPEQNPYSGWMPIFLGVVGALVGLFFFLAYLDIVPVNPDDLNGPRWALAAAGVLFGGAGLLLLSRVFFSLENQRTGPARWVQYFLALSILTTFAALFLWVGFGPGEREFEVTHTVDLGDAFSSPNAILGRLAFGGFGLLVAWLDIHFAIAGYKAIMNNRPFDE